MFLNESAPGNQKASSEDNGKNLNPARIAQEES